MIYKLLLNVFILNLLFRFTIEIIASDDKGVLYLLSRFLLILFIFLRYFKDKEFDYSVIKSKNWLILSFFLIVLTCYNLLENHSVKSLFGFVLFVLKCISVGFLEELLFRYILFDDIKKSGKSLKYSVYLTSLIFAIFHISNLFLGSCIYSVINQIEMAFIFGLFLQFVFLKTNSLVFVSALHALINLTGSYNSFNKELNPDHLSLNDFVANQIFIGIIFIIFLPIYNLYFKVDLTKKLSNE